jgi:ferredoxin, 2Fe-2S
VVLALVQLVMFMLMKIYLNKIPKAQESEQDMIDFVQDADKSSRLSCQIIITNDLDGIVVRMPKKQS